MKRVAERVFVWTGGALFVFALALAAWWYAMPLGHTGTMTASVPARLHAALLDVVLFAAFAAHHSLFARGGVKRWVARVVPERLTRSMYVWIASLLLIAVCLVWQPIGGTIYVAPPSIAALLLVAQLCAVAFIGRAVSAIDALELAGIRLPHDSAPLQTTGPYQLVRHPIYLGWIVIVFLPRTLTVDRLVFATVSSLYLIAAIPWEERSLEAAFGETYRRYRRHVQWRVIPYLY